MVVAVPHNIAQNFYNYTHLEVMLLLLLLLLQRKFSVVHRLSHLFSLVLSLAIIASSLLLETKLGISL